MEEHELYFMNVQEGDGKRKDAAGQQRETESLVSADFTPFFVNAESLLALASLPDFSWWGCLTSPTLHFWLFD